MSAAINTRRNISADDLSTGRQEEIIVHVNSAMAVQFNLAMQ
jgi:hypothetical protein